MSNIKLKFNSIDAYQKILDKAISQLETYGFINDETSEFGNIIQYQGAELIDILNQEYNGRLYSYGNHYDGYGAVYWIFNLDKLNDSSISAIDQFTNEWINKRR